MRSRPRRALGALAFFLAATLARVCAAGVPAPAYAYDLRADLAWIGADQLPDGAILDGDLIEPYFANVAATGLCAERSHLPRARAWMAWYVAHLNVRDRWGLSGTIYDYRYEGGRERSLRTADSVDSYAATFFTLARTAYDTGDAPTRAYVRSIRTDLEAMGAMLQSPEVEQRDGMTIALPTYPVAYLMDNAEVYRGVTDLAYLERAFGGTAQAARYAAFANRVGRGIETLWSPANGTYDSGRQEPRGPSMPSRWSVWYPDATAQLFPALQGVDDPASARSASLWAAFNAAYPQWDALVNGDPSGYPWVLVGETAVVMGDRARASAFAHAIEVRYAAKGFPYPWYDAEAGWYARMLSGLLADPVRP